jgi:hypothetical protein
VIPEVMMNKRIGAAFAFLASLICASPAFAINPNASGPNGMPSRADIQSGTKGLWMWCEVSPDGHQWRARATNTLARDYQCDFKCVLRTEKGPASHMACSPRVPSGARDEIVCGGPARGKTWIGIAEAGAHSCR